MNRSLVKEIMWDDYVLDYALDSYSLIDVSERFYILSRLIGKKYFIFTYYG